MLKGKAEWVSLDVQGYVRINQDGLLATDDWPGKEEVLPLVDILKADSVEAERLTGERDLRTAASILASWGPREVLLTHGGGILVLAEGSFYEAPFVTDVVRGRSGRGDTCTASYLSRRLSAPPADAIVWAAAVTSMKLEKEGPFDRSLDDVEALIRARYVDAAGR
jgi:sugar/nucleoside kinase (ribokinase family)